MTRTHHALAPLAALALTLGACGGDDAQPAAARATGTPASVMPYGTYARTVRQADIDRTQKTRRASQQEAGPNMEPPSTGDVRLVLSKSDAGDILKVVDSSGFAIDMYAEARAGTIALDDYVDPSKGAFCGPEVAVRSSYRFEVTGSGLEIEASPADPCADRDTVLTGTWVKR